MLRGTADFLWVVTSADGFGRSASVRPYGLGRDEQGDLIANRNGPIVWQRRERFGGEVRTEKPRLDASARGAR